jgi:hypothetical protein
MSSPQAIRPPRCNGGNNIEAAELVVSQFVVDEASEGDPVVAEKRLAALSGILSQSLRL